MVVSTVGCYRWSDGEEKFSFSVFRFLIELPFGKKKTENLRVFFQNRRMGKTRSCSTRGRKGKKSNSRRRTKSRFSKKNAGTAEMNDTRCLSTDEEIAIMMKLHDKRMMYFRDLSSQIGDVIPLTLHQRGSRRVFVRESGDEDERDEDDEEEVRRRRERDKGYTEYGRAWRAKMTDEERKKFNQRKREYQRNRQSENDR